MDLDYKQWSYECQKAEGGSRLGQIKGPKERFLCSRIVLEVSIQSIAITPIPFLSPLPPPIPIEE